MKRTIVAVRETVKLSPRGELDRWKVVEYMLDDFGPFIFEINKLLFSWELVKEDMKSEEEGLQASTTR